MATVKKEGELSSPVPMYRKLWTAKQQMGKIHKNSKAQHSKYADLNAVLDACEQILLDNGLMILQPIQDPHIITQIIDVDSGERIESVMSIPPGVTNPQQIGSLISYYRRYSLISLLSMAATDDDGEAASKGEKVTKIDQQKTKPPISDQGFKNALKAISENTFSVDELKSIYSLTPEQLSQL
jgi:hypothetical protein